MAVVPAVPVVPPPPPQAASSGPRPPASSPALALCRRKLRRDSPGLGGPSSDQPSLGCMVAYLSSGGRSAVSRRWLVLTERSVNKSYSYLLHGCRRKTF